VTSGGRAREAAASAAQYVLLGGVAAVAAGISAQGLAGFARDNMGLGGPWPYLLFAALDGAAGVCAVLLTRRAARAESALAPRLAVWGLVAASASFNATHAPPRPGAPEAFGLMPVIAAVLFEFTLRELRQRASGRADRRLAALRWLHPAERVRVQLRLAADDHISAQAATRRVRTELAARRLYELRRALHAQDRAARPGGMTAWRARLAERRAHAALTRAGFTDQATAAEVLRQVQVLTRTRDLARLDYTTAEDAQAAIAALITPGPPAAPPVTPPAPAAPGAVPGLASWHSPAARINGTAAGQITRARQPGPALPPAPTAAQPAATGQAASGELPARQPLDLDLDGQLMDDAVRIVTEAGWRGERLSQKTLGDRLRGQGHRVANHALRSLLAAATDLAADGHAASSQPPGDS
jgi:Protein of unknown function (DUF2637)